MSANAAATVTLDADGHLEIPREISEATGIGPGRQVRVVVVGPGRFEVIASEALGSPDAEPDLAAGPIQPMTLEEAFSRFVTKEPVDLAAIRRQWEKDAAREVVEELARNARRSR